MKGKISITIVLLIMTFLLVVPVSAGDVAGTISVANPKLDSMTYKGPSPSAALTPVVTEVGRISWSIDGLGVYPGTTGIIQVDKPAGATVRKAYMAAATTGTMAYNVQTGDIKIDGSGVAWDSMVTSDMGGHNYWTDVTSLVKAKIDAAPPGRIDMAITETPTYQIDGELLVVIFDDPAQTTDNTIMLMFGAQKMGGDNFNIALADPIDKSDPNLAMEFSLASSYSNQDNSAQYSIVDVNGVRMTTWAGGDDDGTGPLNNGELFTVGGLDDNIANPADAFATPMGNKRYDDELYSLLPFVKNDETQILVHTQNPSMNDNILFAGLYIRSATAIVGKGILLSPASATNQLGEPHTLTAMVQDDAGNPVVQEEVTIEVTSGPNAGTKGSGYTDMDGKFTLTYTSSAEGTDTIIASFVDDSGKTVYSSPATKTWVDEIPPIPEFPTPALPVLMLFGVLFLIYIVNGRKE